MINLDTINYLDTVRGKQPNARFCIGFDGERLGLIAYSLIDEIVEKKLQKTAYVWFAERYEGVGMRRSFDLLEDLAFNGMDKPLKEISIYAKGQRRGQWTFSVEAKRKHDIKINEFEKKAFGAWNGNEVAMTVKDDMSRDIIKAAPEFIGRPEYEQLNAVLRNLKMEANLDVLAEAAVYGLGYFSALESRRKYAVGIGPKVW